MLMLRRTTLVLLVLSVCLALTLPVFADTRYIVQPGDTLTKIAARFGVTVETLVQANQLTNPNTLQIGQALTIPDGIPTAPPMDAATYTVQKGDSLARIAGRFKVSIDALMTANQLASTTLHPGQVLIIPASTLSPLASIYDRVRGSATFMRRIREALDWLQAQDPEAYQRVATYITVIMPSPYADHAQAIHTSGGSCLVRGLARRDMSVEMVAALLYHEAMHCYQLVAVGIVTCKEAEVYAYTEQIAFMERHAFPPEVLDYYRRVLAYYAAQPDDGRDIPPPAF